MSTSKMWHLRELSEDTALFPWNQATPTPAVEALLAVGLLLVVGEATGHHAAASIAAGAAFTIGFAVFHEALSSTLLTMGVLTLGIAVATFAGSAVSHWTALALVLCGIAALGYGLLTSLGPTSTWIAQQSGVYVVIASYFPSNLTGAGGRAAMVLLGGGTQMLVFAIWRLLRRKRLAGNTPALPLLRQTRTRVLELRRGIAHEFRWNAASTGYTLKLCLTLGISTLLYRRFHWRNGYWAPMTALLVLKPKWANTLSRGIARLAGTLLGAAATVLLAHLLPPFHHWTYFILIMATAFGCFALQAVNYAMFSMVLTMYTVFLFGFGGFSERSAADLRVLNTAVGGLLALAVDGLARWLVPAARPVSSPQVQAVRGSQQNAEAPVKDRALPSPE